MLSLPKLMLMLTKNLDQDSELADSQQLNFSQRERKSLVKNTPLEEKREILLISSTTELEHNVLKTETSSQKLEELHL